jgi:hypothetical protein
MKDGQYPYEVISAWRSSMDALGGTLRPMKHRERSRDLEPPLPGFNRTLLLRRPPQCVDGSSHSAMNYGPGGIVYGLGTSGLFVISATFRGKHICVPKDSVALPYIGPVGQKSRE